MAIEIVDFPIKNGGSFHSYVKLPEGTNYDGDKVILSGWWWLEPWIFFFDFPDVGNFIIPTDELIFFRGIETANQEVWPFLVQVRWL